MTNADHTYHLQMLSGTTITISKGSEAAYGQYTRYGQVILFFTSIHKRLQKLKFSSVIHKRSPPSLLQNIVLVTPTCVTIAQLMCY